MENINGYLVALKSNCIGICPSIFDVGDIGKITEITRISGFKVYKTCDNKPIHPGEWLWSKSHIEQGALAWRATLEEAEVLSKAIQNEQNRSKIIDNMSAERERYKAQEKENASYLDTYYKSLNIKI